MIASLISGWIINFISSLNYLGILLLMALESACIPIPSEVIMPFSGYLAWLGKLDILFVAIAGALGCLLGSIVAYFVGLKGGRPFIDKYGKYLLISKHKMDSADKWFKKYGDKAVFISRLLPVVRTFISLPAGIARMDFKKFTAYSFLGSLPWCFLLAYVGFSLGSAWTGIISFFNQLDIVIVISAAALLLWSIFKK